MYANASSQPGSSVGAGGLTIRDVVSSCPIPREKPPHIPAPNPTTPEISNLPAARDAGVDASADAAADASSDAPTAIVRRDAGVDAKVDREQHRKGMPVPDNLLE